MIWVNSLFHIKSKPGFNNHMVLGGVVGNMCGWREEELYECSEESYNFWFTHLY